MIDVSKFLKLLGNELDNVQISEEKFNNILKQCVVKEVNLDNYNINNITKDVNAIVENQKKTKNALVENLNKINELNSVNTNKTSKATKMKKSVFADWEDIDIFKYCTENGLDKGIADFEHLNRGGLIHAANNNKIDLKKDYVYSKDPLNYCMEHGYLDGIENPKKLKKDVLRSIAQSGGKYQVSAADIKIDTPVTAFHNYNEKTENISNKSTVSNETKDVHPINPSEPIENSDAIKNKEEEYKQITFATIGNSSEHEHIFDKDGNEIIDRIDNTNNRLNNFVYDIDGKPLINQNVAKVETTKSEDIPSAAELLARAGLYKETKLNNMPNVSPADQLNNAEFIKRLESINNEIGHDERRKSLDSYDDEYQQKLRNEERLRESYEVNKQAIKEHKAEVRAVRKLKVKNVFATGKNLTNHVIDKLKVGGYKVKEAGYNLGQRFVAAYNGFTQSSYDRSTINTALIDNNLASDYNDIDGMGGRRL